MLHNKYNHPQNTHFWLLKRGMICTFFALFLFDHLDTFIAKCMQNEEIAQTSPLTYRCTIRLVFISDCERNVTFRINLLNQAVFLWVQFLIPVPSLLSS